MTHVHFGAGSGLAGFGVQLQTAAIPMMRALVSRGSHADLTTTVTAALSIQRSFIVQFGFCSTIVGQREQG